MAPSPLGCAVSVSPLTVADAATAVAPRTLLLLLLGAILCEAANDAVAAYCDSYCDPFSDASSLQDAQWKHVK